jgi:hypothetical protein
VIHFVVQSHRPPRDFLAGFGRELAPSLRIVRYRDLFAERRASAGAWIFTDHDRLTPRDREDAAGIWQQLERAGQPVRLLNHPLRVKRRHALLQALHAAGINDFESWRVVDGRAPRRYPVFLRVEDDHEGPRTPLLHDAGMLRAEIDRLEVSGLPREQLLIVELRAAPDAQGVYRKYGAFRVGDRIFPNHLLFGSEWMVKRRHHDHDAVLLAEERRFLEENPHEAELRRAFEIACIDYGRADYGVVGGRLQIYEINTNPTIMGANVPQDPDGRARKQHFARNLIEALRALEPPLAADPPAAIPIASTRTLRERLRPLLRKLSARVFRPPA